MHLYSLFVFLAVYLYTQKGFPSYVDGTFKTLIQHLTLTQNIGFSPNSLSWNYPSWSISVELWVNIILFFLILIFSRTWLLVLFSLFCFIFCLHRTPFFFCMSSFSGVYPVPRWTYEHNYFRAWHLFVSFH